MRDLNAKVKLITDCKTASQSVNTLKVKLNRMQNIDIETPMIEAHMIGNPIIEDIIEECEVRIQDDFKPFQLIPGSKVKHKEEGIIGEIKFIGQEKVAIVWEDNTRERMSLYEAKNSLEYIDDIQTLIAPTSSQMSYNPTVNNLLDKAIAALDEEDNDSIEVGSIEAIVETGTIDLEKIKMQRTINNLEDKLTTKKNISIKEKIANEIVGLAIDKRIIDADDIDIEIQKVLSFNDEQFENYKAGILEYEMDENIVTSSFAPTQPNLTEAELMLQRVKGGKGIIGDFSKEVKELKVHASANPQNISNIASSSSEKRSLTDLKDEKFTFEKVNEKIPTFEEQFENILNDRLSNTKTASNTNIEIPEVKKELPGFENLQGLTKPIRVAEKATSYPTNTNLKDLFSQIGWTTVSTIH